MYRKYELRYLCIAITKTSDMSCVEAKFGKYMIDALRFRNLLPCCLVFQLSENEEEQKLGVELVVSEDRRLELEQAGWIQQSPGLPQFFRFSIESCKQLEKFARQRCFSFDCNVCVEVAAWAL